MRVCPKCGADNADDCKFCVSCGNAFPEEQPEQVVEPETVVEDAPVYTMPQEPEQVIDDADVNVDGKKSNNTLWLILNIASTVLCCCSNLPSIIGIILAAVGMSKSKNGDEEGALKMQKISMILFIVGIVLALLSALVFFVILPLVGVPFLALFEELMYEMDFY